MRNISCINFLITTYCNRLCPDCCCDIPNRKDKQHLSWEEIVEASIFFKGINRINLSGGEPTLHPNFVEFVPKLKELFQCNLLTIETNGYGFEKFPEIFKYFDWIQATHYTKDSYLNCIDNTKEVEFIKEYLKETKVEVMTANITHIPRSKRANGRICGRGVSETAAYVNGLLYPCCAGPGVNGAIGITLTKNWKEEVLKIPIPCSNCWFAD